MMFLLFIITVFATVGLAIYAAGNEEWLLALGIAVGGGFLCYYIMSTDMADKAAAVAVTQKECEAKGGVLAEWYMRRGKHTDTHRACVKKEVVIQ